jgi:hypothetical protein
MSRTRVGQGHDDRSLDDHDGLSRLEAIIRGYKRRYRPGVQNLRRFYSALPSLDSAIKNAGWAKTAHGKRHPHQTRLSGQALGAATAKLRSIRDGLQRCRNFDELLKLVRKTIGSIHGVGELMVYDTADRLGAHLGLEPERVYLHSGTRVGAKALGFSGSDSITPAELPEPLRALEPYELEDCLCIYKQLLGRQEAGATK